MNDNLLIGLPSFEISNTLNENYDYIVRFAQNYILDNKDKYQEKIINNYIDIEEIYMITDDFFGKRDFYINNITNNKVLLTKDDRRFGMNIKNLTISEITTDIAIANVEYTNEYTTITYKYTFEILDNKMIIKNIEVLQ